MRKLLLFLGFLYCASASAQNAKLVVSSRDSSIDEAVKKCLRTAVMQTLAVYATKDTSLIDNRILMDEISTDTHGAIVSYNLSSQILISNGEWAVTTEVEVSPYMAFDLVRNRGYEIEFNGSFYSNKIQNQILKENSEKDAIVSLKRSADLYLQHLFSYKIETSTPKKVYFENKEDFNLDQAFVENFRTETQNYIYLRSEHGQKVSNYFLRNNPNYENRQFYFDEDRQIAYFDEFLKFRLYAEDPIALQDYYYQFFMVNAFPNANFFNLLEYISQTMNKLNMSESECEDYFKLGKRVYPINVNLPNSKSYTFYCRSEESSNLFFNLMKYLENVKDNFIIKCDYKYLKMGKPLEDGQSLFASETTLFNTVNRYFNLQDWSNYDKFEIVSSQSFFTKGELTSIEKHSELSMKSDFSSWDFQNISLNNAVADYLLVDCFNVSNLSKITKFTISDGVIYSGEIITSKTIKKKENNRAIMKEIIHGEWLYSVLVTVAIGTAYILIYN